jgi:hypothetical protein
MLTIEKNKPLYEAVQLTQRRAQERQAAVAAANTPETMPGLAMPGMGAEQPTAPTGPPDIQQLLSQLGGGQAGASQQPGTPGAVLSLGRRL